MFNFCCHFLPSIFYLAGGYSFTINGTVIEYTPSASSDTSVPDGATTIGSSGDAQKYITASGNYLINGFTGSLYINYTPTDSETIDIYLQGSSINLISVISAANVNIYVLSGTNTIGSISKGNDGAVINIYAEGGLLYVTGSVNADSIAMDGGMIAANSFASAAPYSTSSAALAVIDLSDVSDSVSYVWITGADDVYCYALNECDLTTLYLWYVGSLNEQFTYVAEVVFESGDVITLDLSYMQDAGILANKLAEDEFEAVEVIYGNTWTTDGTYTVQYYYDGAWNDTVPIAVGVYSVRLSYTVGGYTAYTTYDSWTVTISAIQVTIEWSNLSVLQSYSAEVTATDYTYGLELTLFYYDYNGYIISAPTEAGVYSVMAWCSQAGYEITNASVTYVIGNYDMGAIYSYTEFTVTTAAAEYTATGRYIYLDGAANYIISSSVSKTAVYDQTAQGYVLLDFGTFDMSYGDLAITSNGFTYCGVAYTGYSGEYTLTGEGATSSVTIGAGCTAYINLNCCSLYSISGDGVVVLTVLKGLSSVQSVNAALVIMQNGGVLAEYLQGVSVTDGALELYACEVQLDGTYAVTNINIDGSLADVSFTASSFVLYLAADEHTIIITVDGEELTYEATYSNGFTCALKNEWISQNYIFTVDGTTVSGTQITEGKAYEISGYSSTYGEVQYLFSDEQNGEYTSTVPTAAGTYYVMAYVAADGCCELYGTAQAFTIIEAASTQTYVVTLVCLGEIVDTLTYTNGQTVPAADIDSQNITAPDGFSFAYWTDESGSRISTSVTIRGDITLYACYTATMTITISGSGTVYVNDAAYTSSSYVSLVYGTEYTITATAASGYVAHLTAEGSSVNGSAYTFTPEGDCSVGAVFDTQGIKVYVGSGSGGVALGIYATMDEALAAADGYSTVYMVLYTDVSGSSQINGNVIVNLNGHVWEADGTVVAGCLTVLDAEESETTVSVLSAKLFASSILQAAESGVVYGTVTVNGGTVTVNGGAVECLNIVSGGAYVTSGIVTSVYVADGATLDISGGAVLAVDADGEVVSGSSQLYELQIPVNYEVTSIEVTYSDGSTSDYNGEAVDGIVYLWLTSDAVSVTFNGDDGHSFTYKNGAFTFTNTWLDTNALETVLDSINNIEVSYLDVIVSDDDLSAVQAKYGTVVLQYSSDGETWSSNYPSSANTYSVRLYVAAGANYTQLASDSVTVIIIKNTVADSGYFTYTLARDLTYDGGEKQVTIDVNVNVGDLGDIGEITVYYSSDNGNSWTVNAPKTAGTYWFAIDIEGTDSIEECTKLRGDGWMFTISPVTVANPQTDDTVFVYSGSAQTYYIESNSLYSITDSVRISAGTYTVTVALKDNVNYCWADDDGDGVITYTFVINPCTITNPEADGATYSYNGGYITYTIADNDLYTVSGNYEKNAGTYTVTVTLNDKTNYCWSDDADGDGIITYTFTIAKASANIAAGETQFSYSENIQFTWSADSDGTATVVYYLNGVECNITAAGVYTAIITIAETDNYLGGSLTVTLTVNKAEQQSAEATVEQGATDELKKGSSYVISLAGLLYYDGTITYASSDESVAKVSEDGTVTIVGSGTYTITVSLTGDSRYEDWSYTFGEVFVEYDFTWVIILVVLLVILAAAATAVVLIVLKRRKEDKSRAAENADAISQALNMYNEESAKAAAAAEQPAPETNVKAAAEQPEQPLQNAAVAEERHAQAEQPAQRTELSDEEAQKLIKRYRENQTLIRKMGWGSEE